MLAERCPLAREQCEAWDEYVQRAPGACHSQLSAWHRVVERTYGHRAFYLWASQDGKVKGILPLILLRSVVFGKSLVSLPFLDDGGICADDEATALALYAHARRLCEEQRADLLDLRHRVPSGLGLAPQGTKVTFVLELAREPDRAWASLDSKVRNQIRKSMKSGLDVSWHGLERLNGFYDAFATNMRDLGSPVHSRKFFATILTEFPESARLILVSDAGRTIGGAVCLTFKDTVMIPWASSRREYRPSCPNHLLYWEAIRWGCQQGFRHFDFGRSSRGSGTYNFKKQWGAVEQPLTWEMWGQQGHRGGPIESSDAKYTAVARAWKHLPVAITRVCGPMLRGQISN